MPSIPIYNQGATEEAGLTRAKKRVIGYMEQGISKLTERPDKDITNGKADDIANLLITQFEDFTALVQSISIYFQEIEGDDDIMVVVETSDEAKKIMKMIIFLARLVGRMERTAKSLLPVMRFLDLGVLSDLKTAQKNAEEAFPRAFTYLTNINLEELDEEEWGLSQVDIDEEDDASSVASSVPSRTSGDPRQRRIDSMFNRMIQAQRELSETSSQSSATPSAPSSRSVGRRRQETLQAFRSGKEIYEGLVMSIKMTFDKILDMIERGYANFNQFRRQRVLPAEAVGEETAQSLTGGMVRRPIYRVGNNVMNAMYEIDGLPRYI
jgi:hypothetical protein